eukprot:TRINITY_DN24264_c0_g1_i1.p1 TRINITY_DN24264_c0_g1~~TRINITY_DN24264_c0_g1_i1.p1  ORF type:complete len:145 (-),score=27.01 TRINITY_DN24264_c0_g1_i1:18-452(-)
MYRRVSELLDLPPRNFESMEFLRYVPGQHYRPHNDAEDFPSAESQRSGIRVMTVFFYLSDVEEGGETTFPLAEPEKILVKPRKGKLVVWVNAEANWWKVSRFATHGSAPVKRGTKYSVNFWVHPMDMRIPENHAGNLCKEEPEY